MLRYQRNHVASCKSGDSCKKCPFWIEGRHQGKRWHQSLKTTDSRTAAQLVQRVILTGKLETEPEKAQDNGITLADAISKFYDELSGRGAKEGTIRPFRKFLGGSPNRHRLNLAKVTPTLPEFATRHGVLFLNECDVDFIREYRQTWKLKAATAGKQLERLKSFFNFCVAQKWIAENPAASLKSPIGSDDDVPVIPFTKEQFARIIKACGDNEYLKTFILVMRYSGLATVDAVKLTPDRLEGNHLRLRRTKTRGWVKVLLPGVVADRLRDLPLQPCGFWFWNKKETNAKHETATGNMRRMLRPIFGPKGANIALKDEEGHPIRDSHGKQKYGHPYQLRHTFVKEQLENGASLERIAELLGNTYKIVEMHYQAWVKDRQKILDETVRGSWDQKELAGY